MTGKSQLRSASTAVAKNPTTSNNFGLFSLATLLLKSKLEIGLPSDTVNAEGALKNLRLTIADKHRASFCPPDFQCHACIVYLNNSWEHGDTGAYRDRCAWTHLTDCLPDERLCKDGMNFKPYVRKKKGTPSKKRKQNSTPTQMATEC